MNPLRLKAIDLRPFMRHGIDHIYNGAVDRRYNCHPFGRFNLTDPPTCAIHLPWENPHMVGRFLDALAVCSTVIDFEPDEEAGNGLRKFLHDCLDNEYTLPYHILLEPSKDGSRSAWMHNCREILLGLLGLLKWKGDEQSGELAKKFVRAIDRITFETGTFSSNSFSNVSGWGKFNPAELNMTSGRLIRAMLQYYHDTEDELGITLAKRFADINIEYTFTPEGGLTEHTGNHQHSTLGTVTGLLDLGLLTGEKRYYETAKAVYDIGMRPWRTSYGWTIEYMDYEKQEGWHGHAGEVDSTGDLIEAAVIMGLNGHGEYFRDAENFIRNTMLASQILNTEWIQQSEEKDTKDKVYSNIRPRAMGAFAFTIPNSYIHYHTDLAGGALQSLSEAYHAIVSEDSAGIHINMLFTAESDAVAIKSYIPETGKLEIYTLIPSTLFVRLPDWVDRKTLNISVNEMIRDNVWKNKELFIGKIPEKTIITITFDQPEHHTVEGAKSFDTMFEIDWIGDTIVDMKPGPTDRVATY